MLLDTFTSIMLMALEHKDASVFKSKNDRFLSDRVDANVPFTIGESVAYIKVSTYVRDSISIHEHGPQFILNFVGYITTNGTVTLLDGVNRAKSKNYLKIECSSIMTEVDLVCLIENKFDAWTKFVTKKNKSQKILDFMSFGA